MKLRTALTGLTALALAAALGACGEAADRPTSRSAAPGSTSPGSSPAEQTRALPNLVARASSDLAVFDAPDAGDSMLELAASTDFGSPRALLVEERSGDWLRVVLPVRPNGTTGWVRAADVELRAVEEALVIDLGARTLTFTRADEVVLETPIAMGAPDTPTPTGRFSVTDLLDTGSEESAYGPFALGLSGYSDTLSEFGGGDGQIGVHGTDDPDSIGRDVSHGCVRVPNDVITRLAAEIPLGTPVTIL